MTCLTLYVLVCIEVHLNGAQFVGEVVLMVSYRAFPQIGVDYGVKTVITDDLELKVNFWDLSGHPEFFEVRNEFYKDTQAVSPLSSQCPNVPCLCLVVSSHASYHAP